MCPGMDRRFLKHGRKQAAAHLDIELNTKKTGAFLHGTRLEGKLHGNDVHGFWEECHQEMVCIERFRFCSSQSVGAAEARNCVPVHDAEMGGVDDRRIL